MSAIKKRNTPLAGGVVAEKTNTDDRNSTARGAAKRFATVQARAALMGAALDRIEDDRGRPVYVLTRRALTRLFDHLGQVEAWLEDAE